MEQVEVYAPATVANVVCGFDVLGFALEAPGDRMLLRKSDQPGVHIIHHDEFRISTEPIGNVAGITLLEMLKAARPDFGLELEISKGIMPGSGLGSSAASAAGAAVAANYLLGELYSPLDLIGFAMAGESFASGGARHADNIAPAVLGGFTLVRSVDPVDVVSLRHPPLVVTVVHPQVEIKTSAARAMLPTEISAAAAIRQTANIGALVAGLDKGDYDLIARSLEDHIVEPVRSILIPKYGDLIRAAKDAGALGGGIAGSGPSVFMFSVDESTARDACIAMSQVYEGTEHRFETYISPISPVGVQVVR